MSERTETVPPPGIAFVPVKPVQADTPHPYWTMTRVAQALGTGPRSSHAFAGVSTDTRKIRKGDLFVALGGDNFDAHDFLATARDNGAAAFVVSNALAASGLGVPTYVVNDTLLALGQLATAWRRAWGGTVVAVAGSNGKTSTKDMLRAALGSTMSVHATAGNFNNLVGVPLTLLALPPTAQIAVVEVGTNTPGEVGRLREIVQPDIAVLTSIGEEHLEGLGDIAGVLREECQIFPGVEIAVVPTAYPDVEPLARAGAKQVVRAGLAEGDIVPSEWGLANDGSGWLVVDGVRVTLTLRGAHQVANATLVLAAARACGVTVEQAAAGLANMPVPNMRGVWEPLGTAVLLNDAYNANPPSMRAALALLDSVGNAQDGNSDASGGAERITGNATGNRVGDARQRVAVLGSMRELGAHAHAQHIAVAQAALAGKANVIAAVGDFAAAFDEIAPGNPRVIAVREFEDLWPQLEPRLNRDAIILLKASRGAKMERLVPFLSAWANA